MDTTELRARIVDILDRSLPVELEEIPEGASFEELGVESVEALNVMVALEEEFGIDLEDCPLEEANTLEKLMGVVGRLLAGADAPAAVA